MAREPIKNQDRFGPAQSRAAVFSTFVQARRDPEAGQDLEDLSSTLRDAAGYASDREQQQAQDEIEQGQREFAAGLVQDGQRIIDGELQPIESSFYMTGVEMGRGRRRGREVWAAFQEWQGDNPRPGLGSTQSYEEWLETGLAFAQERAGVDPETMSEHELDQFSGVVNQARQRDHEQFLSQLNQEAVQESVESLNSDILGLGIEYDPQDISSTYVSAEGMLSWARANGLDVESVRGTILTEFINIARTNSDPSILENMPNNVLMSPAINQRRLSAIEVVNNDIEAARYEGETEVLSGIQEMLQGGNTDGAQQALDLARDAGRVRSETHLSWDQRIHNERRTLERETLTQARRSVDNAREGTAIQSALANGTAAAGVSWIDSRGEAQYTSPDQLATQIQAEVLSEAGHTVAGYAHLSNLTEQTRIMFPALESWFQDALSISRDRLETGDVTPAQEETLRGLIEMNESVLSAYLDGRDLDRVRTARFLQQTGRYTPAESLSLAMNIEGHSPSGISIGNYEGRVGALLQSENRTWAQYLTQVDLPLLPALELPGIDRYNQYEDNAATAAWRSNIAERAAQIESAAGREAAQDYMERAVQGTMVVNRQPVSPIGPISGPEGTAFLNDAMRQIGVDYLADELDASYDDNWWNVLTGRAGEWNPDDEDMRNAFLGEVDVRSVPGGVRFEVGEANAFLSTQQLLELESQWREEQERIAQRDLENNLEERFAISPWINRVTEFAAQNAHRYARSQTEE